MRSLRDGGPEYECGIPNVGARGARPWGIPYKLISTKSQAANFKYAPGPEFKKSNHRIKDVEKHWVWMIGKFEIRIYLGFDPALRGMGIS
jgi:hypothetical protein